MAREKDSKQKSAQLGISSKFISVTEGFILYATEHKEKTIALLASSVLSSESTLESNMYQQNIKVNKKKNELVGKKITMKIL